MWRELKMSLSEFLLLYLKSIDKFICFHSFITKHHRSTASKFNACHIFYFFFLTGMWSSVNKKQRQLKFWYKCNVFPLNSKLQKINTYLSRDIRRRGYSPPWNSYIDSHTELRMMDTHTVNCSWHLGMGLSILGDILQNQKCLI